jgi:hypothetical protein
VNQGKSVVPSLALQSAKSGSGAKANMRKGIGKAVGILGKGQAAVGQAAVKGSVVAKGGRAGSVPVIVKGGKPAPATVFTGAKGGGKNVGRPY